MEWLTTAALNEPGASLIAGIAVAALATLGALLSPPHAGRKRDPLDRLFDPDKLETELARVAGRPAHAYRAASPSRAAPHGQRAMLAHLAQAMRADVEDLDSGGLRSADKESDCEWEEVLLLPPPSPRGGIARAA